MKRPRSTHSELAAILDAIAGRLEKVPAGYCVSDGGTLRALHDAAAALCAQDARIAELTVALRTHGGAAARAYFRHRAAGPPTSPQPPEAP